MSLINNPYNQSDPQEQPYIEDWDERALAWSYINEAWNNYESVKASDIAEKIYMDKDFYIDRLILEQKLKHFLKINDRNGVMDAFTDIKRHRNNCQREIDRVGKKIEARLHEIEQLKELIDREEKKLIQYDKILKHCQDLFHEEKNE